MKARFHNCNVDVVIEGDDVMDIRAQFYRDYPKNAAETILIDWDYDDEDTSV